jgi:glycine/D-amino acid oxidase-like deaminating enzyme
MSTYEVGIVGAGVHGAAAAYHLTMRGVRPVVVERTTPAGGPTGLSSGICRAYYTNDFLARVARDAIEMFERFEEIIGSDAGHRRTGLYLLHPEDDVPVVRDSVARLNELGIETDLLDPEQLAERLPAFDLSGVAIGAYERHAGYADPHATTEGLLRAALERGAELRLHTEVAGVEPAAAGGGTLVTDSGERIDCGRVLLATGPWTRPLAGRVGVDLPLTVERHAVATFRWGPTEPVPGFGDVPGGFYLRPEGDELFLLGMLTPASQVDPDDFRTTISPDEVEHLARLLVSRVPSLDAAQVHGGWASLYDVSPDWQPVIGEIAPGIVVDAGTSGHGFKLAPALGAHVADLVLGEPVDPGLAAFSPARFDAGHGLDAGFGEVRILG